MGNLLIRDLAPALKAKISSAANSNGRSMSEEVKARLQEDFAETEDSERGKTKSAFDEIRAIFSGTLMSDDEHDEFTRVIEESRREFGRPPPDFE